MNLMQMSLQKASIVKVAASVFCNISLFFCLTKLQSFVATVPLVPTGQLADGLYSFGLDRQNGNYEKNEISSRRFSEWHEHDEDKYHLRTSSSPLFISICPSHYH